MMLNSDAFVCVCLSDQFITFVCFVCLFPGRGRNSFISMVTFLTEALWSAAPAMAAVFSESKTFFLCCCCFSSSFSAS